MLLFKIQTSLPSISYVRYKKTALPYVRTTVIFIPSQGKFLMPYFAEGS